MRARVFVTLKPSVFDPQGTTVAEALHTLGYNAVKDVRQGKYFELDIDAKTSDDARRLARTQQALSAKFDIGVGDARRQHGVVGIDVDGPHAVLVAAGCFDRFGSFLQLTDRFKDASAYGDDRRVSRINRARSSKGPCRRPNRGRRGFSGAQVSG